MFPACIPYVQHAGQYGPHVKVSYTITLHCLLLGKKLQKAKQPDVKARINGVAARMKEFKFFYCLMLAERLLNLSVLYALDYCYLLLLIIIGFIFGTARLRYYSCLAPVKLYA